MEDQEKQFPMILHQKLSVVIAREIFHVTDPQVLSSIGCHTTLKAGASRLDKVVFLADKIAWDQDGDPAYLHEMRAALDQSLDAAVDGEMETRQTVHSRINWGLVGGFAAHQTPISRSIAIILIIFK